MKENIDLKIPNFFLVGAAKCGTTSVYEKLKLHPDVYLSAIKEPNFFGSDIDPSRFSSIYKKTYVDKLDKFLNEGCKKEIFTAYIKDKQIYEKLFYCVRGEKVIGEISNSYLYSESAASEIFKYNPIAKILIILRNPIDRAFSHYQMDYRMGLVRSSFIEEIHEDLSRKIKGWGISNLYIELGLYSKQIKRFIDVFPASQVKIILFDDMKNDFRMTYEEICDYLDISHDFNGDLNDKCNPATVPRKGMVGLNRLVTKVGFRRLATYFLNESGIEFFKGLLYKKSESKILSADREYLLKYFENDIIELEKIIGRDLSSWLN